MRVRNDGKWEREKRERGEERQEGECWEEVDERY